MLFAVKINEHVMYKVKIFEFGILYHMHGYHMLLCSPGAALIAFEMFVELSKKAAILSETELSAELKEKGE